MEKTNNSQKNKYIITVKKRINESIDFINKNKFSSFKNGLNYVSSEDMFYSGWINCLMYNDLITFDEYDYINKVRRDLFYSSEIKINYTKIEVDK